MCMQIIPSITATILAICGCVIIGVASYDHALLRRKKMAAAPEVRETPFDKLKKEITCAVCHGHYQQARVLPCNHYYCTTCIEKLTALHTQGEQTQGEDLQCPECHKELTLPAGGAAELSVAFCVEGMKRVYDMTARTEGEAQCEKCPGEKAVAFCRKCAEIICSGCVDTHEKNRRTFFGHVVLNLRDMNEEEIIDISRTETLPIQCPKHVQEEINLFCRDCDRFICRNCTIRDHKDHDYDLREICASETRSKLQDSLASLQGVQSEVGDGIANAERKITCEVAKIDEQKDEICKAIEESIDKLKQFLDRRKEELMTKANELAKQKKKALFCQRKDFSTAQTAIRQLVKLIQKNISYTSDHDLMNIQKQLQTNIEEGEEQHQKLKLELTAHADIQVSLRSPCPTTDNPGFVFDRSPPSRILERSTLCNIKVGFPVDVSIFAPTATLCDISAELKCVAKASSSLQGDVVQKGVGIYSVSLTPQVRGRHDLTVRIKDEEIDGSPFQLDVTIPPSQIGNVDNISGFTRPWGIAINNKQQLVVTESFGNGGEKVMIMGRDEKNKEKTIECPQFRDPCGVAVDIRGDGAIYVTDVKAHSLFKFSKDGTLLKTVDNELEKPYSVKIIKNELYVVDYANCLVKLFDMDCNVIRTIQTKECPNARDIAQGPDGLYIAGEGKISVYALDGAFIRHLNLQLHSLELSAFNSICFDSSGHIIASDTDNGVYVFKPSGECVRLVGSDVVQGPAGVAVDEDGYVYVCDASADKVIVL